MWEIYQENIRRNPNLPHFGTRNQGLAGKPYEWKTYREVYDLMDLFARGTLV